MPLPISPCQEWRWTILEREVPCNQWEGSTCTHDGPYFFLSEDEGGEGSLIFFSLIPDVFPNMFLIKFSKCSQMRSLEVHQVPKLFPKVFPKAPQFYPIWFAQSSILMYINWKGFNYKGIHLFLFCNLVSKEMLPLGRPQCSKIFVDGPRNMALLKN